MQSFKLTLGGKLAEQLEGAIKSHRHSTDGARQSLAKAFDERGIVNRGGGIQCRIILSADEIKLFLEDINDLHRAHSGIDGLLEKAQRNRLVGIQAMRTKNKLEGFLARAGAN